MPFQLNVCNDFSSISLGSTVSIVLRDNAAQLESDLNSVVLGRFPHYVDVLIALLRLVGRPEFFAQVGSAVSFE